MKCARLAPIPCQSVTISYPRHAERGRSVCAYFRGLDAVMSPLCLDPFARGHIRMRGRSAFAYLPLHWRQQPRWPFKRDTSRPRRDRALARRTTDAEYPFKP